MGLATNVLGTGLQAAQGMQFAEEQQQKADDFTRKAAGVITKKITDDPAYILKQYLAQNGMPGLQQYLEDIDENQADQLSIARKGSSGGGQLLAYLAALQGQSDAGKRKLYQQSSESTFQQEERLANDRFAWQNQFDEMARQERARLNKVASQYQAAADLNKVDASRMLFSMIGSTGNSLGSIVDGSSSIGGGVSMGGGMAGGMGASLGGMIGG